jgi:hypothetical protein
MAITALVLAIVGMLTSLLFIGFPLAIVALILGIVALARRLDGKGMSVAAIVISAITLLWGVFLLVIVVFAGALSSVS